MHEFVTKVHWQKRAQQSKRERERFGSLLALPLFLHHTRNLQSNSGMQCVLWVLE